MIQQVTFENFIKKEPIRYLFLKDFAKRVGKVVYVDENTCYVFDENTKILYAAGKFVEHPVLVQAELVCTSSKTMQEELCKRKLFRPSLDVYTGYYLKDSILVEEKEGYSISCLTMDHLDYLLKHYNNPCNSKDHLKDRIEKGMMGLFDHDQLVGFIGMHDEGTMGYLYIQEDHRKMGLATYLEGSYIQYLLEHDILPYCHVITDNIASINLQESLGLTFEKKPYYWLGKDE